MAAVASRSSNNSPHPHSRMTNSPKDSKKSTVKTEVDQRKETSPRLDQETTHVSPAQQDIPPSINLPDDANPAAGNGKDNTVITSSAQPLAPPPRPTQNNPPDTPDYFSTNHNNNKNNNNSNSDSNSNSNSNSHFSLEPNPFESSFASGPAETPGKNLLPPVTSLTSPAPLGPGGTPGWSNSLWSGPLSPAMLAGPTNDYFSSDHHFRGSFPTPNESSLRTGLTPGGGGSMFPAPSPNSQALYNSLQSGGATPSTLDFHRTAMNVRAASQSNNYNNITSNGPTSQATEQGGHAGMDHKQYNPAQAHQHGQPDPYGHDANDAANGLFLLAQANGARNNNQFAVPPQPANHSMQHMPNQMHQQTQDTSPNMAKRATKNSIGSSVSGSARGMSEGGEFSESGNSEQAKPQSRSTGRGKKGSAPKAVTNGRRKAEDTPSKGQANKRSKGNNGSANASSEQLAQDQDMLMDSDDDGSVKQEFGENGKKMTDEEKRKNFLERNRVAALKCRQRKKQWLANLQAKVELFSTENDALSATVTQLREEVVNLKTLLMAHKDCPVSQSQGISGLAMDAIAGNPHQYTNPYGMAMPQGMPPGMPPGMPQQQQGMQRRFGEPHEQYER